MARKTRKIDKKQILNDYHRKGLKPAELAKLHDCGVSTIYAILQGKTKSDVIFDLTDFDKTLSEVLATKTDNALKLLDKYKLSESTATQLTGIITKLIETRRLIENKSTVNVYQQATASLSDKDRQLIQGVIKQMTDDRISESRAKISTITKKEKVA